MCMEECREGGNRRWCWKGGVSEWVVEGRVGG